MPAHVHDDESPELVHLRGGDADTSWIGAHCLDEVGREAGDELAVGGIERPCDLLQARVRIAQDVANGHCGPG